ncbi:type II toxin-antitoxin system RelB/DinJ family antitoxin [Pseudomonas carassii]|uniref:Type II toxin-antitoxin system RelB/DinJ family antitoxin n=1 Tax=Pseudomonas carassii TaxID=3115855 RepID=A0ABU7HI33_9PSED|nr:type II toxin-antitoxin system RelB/DinJ family antitoxin [Pseudomonas sp. 137P]MEE1890994.1 type II toxin-antitoxin system RelB/DinJ family antitoxin [Pseudomonas sp. 137P]
MAHTEVVRTRIDSELKTNATKILDEMGITVSQAIRMMLVQVVQTKALPFEVKALTLNQRARQVMEAQDRDREVQSHDGAEALFKDLGI